jgi:hypothetical protein
VGRQKQRQKQRQRQRQSDRRPQTVASRPATRARKPSRGTPWVSIAAGAAVAVLVIAFAASRALSGNSATSPTPTLAPLSAAVDGISCDVSEQLAYHIHQYVELYDHGHGVNIPAEIGIPVTKRGDEFSAPCLYWLHVHAGEPDIIHVESPTQTTYTFGKFLDIWKKTASHANPPSDAFVTKLEKTPTTDVRVYLNLKPWKIGYRNIPLKEHGVITVEIGRPFVRPTPFTRWGNL